MWKEPTPWPLELRWQHLLACCALPPRELPQMGSVQSAPFERRTVTWRKSVLEHFRVWPELTELIGVGGDRRPETRSLNLVPHSLGTQGCVRVVDSAVVFFWASVVFFWAFSFFYIVHNLFESWIYTLKVIWTSCYNLVRINNYKLWSMSELFCSWAYRERYCL